jgi:hypothetical protein
MYFPTLLDLGMHRGPLLAYLISDPELSLQSILITASIIGRLKAWVYVGWMALFSTLAGHLDQWHQPGDRCIVPFGDSGTADRFALAAQPKQSGQNIIEHSL